MKPAEPLTHPHAPGLPARRPARLPRLPEAWVQVLAGPPGPTRSAVWRLLLIVPSYVFLALLLLAAIGMGLAPPRETGWVFAYALGGIGLIYALLRSGRAARLADPMLVFPQICFNITVVVLAYALVPLTRSLAVQWLCLLILFDMGRLSGRQVLLAAGLAYGLLISAMGALHLAAPQRIDIAAESVNVAMACVTLGALLAVTRVSRRVDEQRRKQQQQLAATVAKLDELAIRDALTGAGNRRHTEALLQAELSRHARGGRPFCVALLDVDHFKKVNDRHGHAVGDAVLRELVRLLREALPASMPVGRWGGEEFVVLLPEHRAPEALAVLQAAALNVRRHDWPALADGLQVSFSAGLVEYRTGAPLDAVLEQADRALYAAKAAGRDRIFTAPPEAG